MSRRSYDNESLKEIGKKIRAIRGAMKQEEFGELIGASRVSVSNYEAGRRLPNREILENIAKAGGISVDKLLSRTSVDNIEQLESLKRIKEYMGVLSRARLLPADSYSADEEALVELLRHIPPPKNIEVFKLVVSLYQASGAKSPMSDKLVSRLDNAVEKGDYERGTNYKYLIDSLREQLSE